MVVQKCVVTNIFCSNTPLTIAAAKGQTAVMEELLKAGCGVDVRGGLEQQTALLASYTESP